MKLTAYEQGKKTPAELFPAPGSGPNAKPCPHINRRFNLSGEEKQRRRKVLAKALKKAGSISALSTAIGFRPMVIRNWDMAKHAIPDERLAVLERYLAGEVPHEAH
ncbi:hypothetical protein EKK97_13915 [Billgrantia tianxiuensis]|uniref:Uncharacterized protein n=1 Tax=Billgrantia tianxiuensis TaxID=2497861 RepID=A0A6I6SML8_9GAMM|nr:MULTISPECIES: hypothetical protein [Halomonas]MCE8034594.1 hypothetical protein [Halomonas sp. MCCC 1A11057]QHC50461.1 hypothetical protein EKK97_13915 [Halomonas tianxiuensis]